MASGDAAHADPVREDPGADRRHLATTSRTGSWSASTTATPSGTTSTASTSPAGKLTPGADQHRRLCRASWPTSSSTSAAPPSRGPTAAATIYRVVDGKVEAKPFEAITLEDAQTTSPVGFTTDGKTLYWIDSRGRDTAALIAQDVATGAQDGDRRERPRRHRRRDGQPEDRPGRGLCGQLPARTSGRRSAPRSRATSTSSKSKLKGEISVTSRTDADDKWIVAVDPVTAPVGGLSLRPQGEDADQALHQPARARGRAAGGHAPGRDQVARRPDHGLLPDPAAGQRPRRRRQAGQGGADGAAGPWRAVGPRRLRLQRPTHQWLANRGYAVLSPNFRASTGFGKKFIAAGDLQWGLKMHDDLIDAVDWAVGARRHHARQGGDHGRLLRRLRRRSPACLHAGQVRLRRRHRRPVQPRRPCSKTIPPYWEAGKAQFYKRMGDPRHAGGPGAARRERSPLYKADQIKRPLLIGQGANDPRVNVAESRADRRRDEGQGHPGHLRRLPRRGPRLRPAGRTTSPSTRWRRISSPSCLGGRAEPIGDALKPSIGAGAARRGICAGPGGGAAEVGFASPSRDGEGDQAKPGGGVTWRRPGPVTPPPPSRGPPPHADARGGSSTPTSSPLVEHRPRHLHPLALVVPDEVHQPPARRRR